MIPTHPTTNYPPVCHVLWTTRSPMDLRSNTSFLPHSHLGCGLALLPRKSWTPQAPCPSHPRHPPCHPHTTPPCHHRCFLLPSFLPTLPHPCCFACVPLGRGKSIQILYIPTVAQRSKSHPDPLQHPTSHRGQSYEL